MKELLGRYAIKAKTVRVGGKPVKGFHLNQFEDALLRYECGILPVTGYNGYIVDNENNDVTNVTCNQPSHDIDGQLDASVSPGLETLRRSGTRIPRPSPVASSRRTSCSMTKTCPGHRDNKRVSTMATKIEIARKRRGRVRTDAA
jgi:hypothetical protein